MGFGIAFFVYVNMRLLAEIIILFANIADDTSIIRKKLNND